MLPLLHLCPPAVIAVLPQQAVTAATTAAEQDTWPDQHNSCHRLQLQQGEPVLPLLQLQKGEPDLGHLLCPQLALLSGNAGSEAQCYDVEVSQACSVCSCTCTTSQSLHQSQRVWKAPGPSRLLRVSMQSQIHVVGHTQGSDQGATWAIWKSELLGTGLRGLFLNCLKKLKETMSLVFFAILCTISWSLVSQFSSIKVSRHRNKAAKALQHEFCSQDDGILMFCLSKANWQRWDYQLLLSEHQKRLLHSWKACHSFKSACLISNICQSMVTYKVKTYSKVKNSNSNWHFEAQLICHEV